MLIALELLWRAATYRRGRRGRLGIVGGGGGAGGWKSGCQRPFSPESVVVLVFSMGRNGSSCPTEMIQGIGHSSLFFNKPGPRYFSALLLLVTLENGGVVDRNAGKFE